MNGTLDTRRCVARLRALAAGVLMGSMALGRVPASAAELPVPCGVGSCGNAGPTTFVTSGAATYATAGNTLTINQSTNAALLNWSSFNIDANGRVIFVQPNASAIALNRIYQESPSQIFGHLDANGQIYLVNPNGLIFGSTAKVNAAGILASTLNMADDVFDNGLLSALATTRPALASDGRLSVVDANGQPVLGADGQPMKVQLVVQSGAQLATTQPSGRVLLAGQEVDNGGSISAPDGQIILAAGDKVYLQASSNPALRGLLVEVDAGGRAWNQLSGQLQSARGDITMVGLAVNQDGRVSASTSVAANGSVRLLARDTATFPIVTVGGAPVVTVAGTRGGTLTLGPGSTTEVLPDLADKATAVDDQPQLPSSIEMTGQSITLAGGSKVVAPGGALSIAAATDPLNINVANDPLAQLQIASGALLDLSGSDAVLPVTANLVDVQLRANELRDSPDQRNGALRGKTVTVDARVGTQVADVSGAVAALPKNIAQRTSAGGTAVMSSNGSLAIASGATIDVSGGQTTFLGGNVNTSQLIRADGSLVDVSVASESDTYVGVLNSVATVLHDRWGVVQTFSAPGAGHFEPGYVSGASAGTIQLQAPAMAMAGTLLGHAVNGPYQRNPASALYAQGGQLVVGSSLGAGADFRAPDVILARTAGQMGTGLPTPEDALQLSVPDFVSGGFRRLQVWSNGTVSVPTDTPLDFMDGSSVQLRANRIDVLSEIRDLAGSLDLGTQLTVNTLGTGQRSTVSIGDNVALDVRGAWINDTEQSNPERPTATLFQNGGSIALAAGGPGTSLALGNGVQLLADGGAWLNRSAQLKGGTGGSISLLSSGQDAALTVGAGTQLEAFGVNSAPGGRFDLSAGRLQLVDGARWTAAQSYDPADPANSSYFRLGTALFEDYGFARFKLTASGGTAVERGDSLELAAGTAINAVTGTLLLDPASADQSSGGVIAGFSTKALLPEFARQPTAISLSVTPYAGYAGGRLGDLNLSAQSQVAADAGSNINLASTGGNIVLNGTVVTHGGNIVARVAPPPNANEQGYDAALGLSVGAGAALDVSGIAVLKPSDTGLRQGTVWAGGAISLLANRGTLSLASGSLLDVSGTAAVLDLTDAASAGSYRSENIASNAGSITLGAAESIMLAGSLAAHAGVGDTGRAMGGALGVQLTRDSAALPGLADVRATFPTAPRVVELGNAPAGAPVNGQALVNVAQLVSGGFDDLRLRADDVAQIDAGVALTLDRRLSIDAPALAVGGSGQALLAAPYVALGNSQSQPNAASASAGGGRLQVNAQFIDVVGNSVLQNTGSATLHSAGDVQLRGVVGGAAITGSLGLAGDLTLEASRAYATTATQFTIASPNGTVNVRQTKPSAGTPYSAASSLTIAAANINQGGTLLAPFGHIELDASAALNLLPGSLTSAAASGTVIPYGKTVNGTDWIYDAGTNVPLTLAAVPQRQVALAADALTIARGATVDISGGGDLHAFEWINGTGGSSDALAASIPNLYAILPALGAGYASYDAQDFKGSAIQPGDSVFLSASPGLAAGFYTLLPARYALLPGAYLVSAINGFTDLQPGSSLALPGGAAVVPGYLSFGDTGIGGTRNQAFALSPGSDAHRLAQFDDTLASSFFSRGAVRTADAGLLSLNAIDQLTALGTVNTAAAAGGTGASVEVSAADLNIVGSNGADTTSGVVLQADVIDGWHAARLLLGGRRSAPDQSIAVAADQVTVVGAAHLSADEVVLVGRQGVTISSDSQIVSTSATAGTAPAAATSAIAVKLSGPGSAQSAFTAVSDFGTLIPVRGLAANGDALGTVTIESGSTLGTRGGLTVDAPGGTVLGGVLGGDGASWALGGNDIVVGGAGNAGSVGLTSTVLGQMQSAGAVRLASSGNIDFASAAGLGSPAAPLTSLTIGAATLSNSGTQSVSLFADSIALRGSASAASAAGQLTGGTLSLIGRNIQVGGTALTVHGFGATALQAAGQILGTDSARLNVDGALSLSAARLSAASAADARFQAAGDVQIVAALAAADMTAPEIGGALSISGLNLTDGAALTAPSGSISLSAVNTLTLLGTATVDTSSAAVVAAGHSATTSGGRINLRAGGDLTLAAGSLLNVAAAGQSPAGRIAVSVGGNASLAGELRGGASPQSTGGSFDLQAARISDFVGFSSALQTGGFTGAQLTHVGHGDLVVGAGATLQAHDVALITDDGQVAVVGTIVAPSAATRGSIRLYGSTGVTLLGTGSLHADAQSSSGRGGLIELGAGPGGSLALEQGGSVTATGGEAGGLWLRAPAANGTDVAISTLNADLSHAGEVTIEPVLPAFAAPALIGQTEIDAYLAAARTYTDSAATVIQARLNPTGLLAMHIQPGIELQSDADLTLGPLDLSAQRFSGEPAVVTVRTRGSISVNGITDGFGADGSALADRSASLRLIAGGNLASADPLALDTATVSDLSIAAASIVRTGTGNIDLGASRDLTIGAGASVYSGGNPVQPFDPLGSSPVGILTHGGSLRLSALRDVIGTPVAQSVTAWLQRVGSSSVPTRWGNDVSQFGWSLGSFGGGDLDVRAGRDLSALSAAAADSAVVADDGQSIGYYGGGGLNIEAGADVAGGMFYLARGAGQLAAGDAVRASDAWNYGGLPLGVFLALGDAQLAVSARAGVSIAGVVNPTVLRLPSLRARAPYFFSYGPDSSLSASSASGTVAFSEDSAAFGSFLGATVAGGSGLGPNALPANLALTAYSGDIEVKGSGYLLPSNRGQLSLFADRDVRGIENGSLTLSDAAATVVPTAFKTQSSAVNGLVSADAASGRHLGDSNPALVVAGRDIVDLGVAVSKPLRLVAGRDILESSSIFAQNLAGADISEIAAGRDFIVTAQGGGAGVSVGGPGRLDVLAGRDMDLGVSAGLVTTGNLRNANLPDADGAAINVLAGVAHGLDYSALVAAVTASDTTAGKALIDYMYAATGQAGLTLEQALSAYRNASSELQRPFALRTFFNELVASGRAANSVPGAGFARGYAAIDALLPGNRAAANPYLGDINLTYSRIYTLAGGDITLLAPGGSVNVGVATPPANAAIRGPSELGIVAQKAGNVGIYSNGDVLVNESRVFTLLGGDIAIWSSLGNIDAGRGAKSSLSAPPPTVLVDSAGNVKLDFSGAIAGSGIRTIATSADAKPGDVDLIAPTGFVNAGDAGIGSAGNINIAAHQVIGVDNIQFGGAASGVPAQTSGLGASLAGIAAVGTSATSANGGADTDDAAQAAKTPLTQNALSWLEVFVMGLGEDACRPDDMECLRRQSRQK